MTDLAHGAITVVGRRQYQHGRAPRPVAFEHDFVDLPAFELARAAHDGPLDVFGRHADVLGVVDGRAQARITVGIASAARRDGDFLDDFRELLTALSVGGGFLVLDRRPFRMTGHYRPLPYLRDSTGCESPDPLP